MRRIVILAVIAAVAGGAGAASASQCDPKAVGGCLAQCVQGRIDIDDPVGSVTSICRG